LFLRYEKTRRPRRPHDFGTNDSFGSRLIHVRLGPVKPIRRRVSSTRWGVRNGFKVFPKDIGGFVTQLPPAYEPADLLAVCRRKDAARPRNVTRRSHVFVLRRPRTLPRISAPETPPPFGFARAWNVFHVRSEFTSPDVRERFAHGNGRLYFCTEEDDTGPAWKVASSVRRVIYVTVVYARERIIRVERDYSSGLRTGKFTIFVHVRGIKNVRFCHAVG